jgi:F-type H+-transporting ATPase subunit b
MQIDWFTLTAQIINFLILLYLLKHFLYQPILDTMDQREQNIAARLQDAEQKRAEAEQQAEEYQRQQQELQDKRDQKLEEILQDVEAQRKKLLQEAKHEVRSKKKDWFVGLRREQEKFLQDLRLRIGTQTAKVASRALQDLADIQIELRMAEKFIARIQELEPAEKADISDSLRHSDQPIVVRSTFDLPDELQHRIATVLQEQFGGETNTQPGFERASDLIAGIEMQVDGHRVSWTIRDYLYGLESQITQVLEHEEGPAKNEVQHGT